MFAAMVDDRPVLYMFAAEPLPEGRTRGIPLRVSLDTAEWLMRERHWAVVGPDPEDEIALATWQRTHRLHDTKT